MRPFVSIVLFCLIGAFLMPYPVLAGDESTDCADDADPTTTPDLDDVIHSSEAAAKRAQYETLLQRFTADELDALDADAASTDLLVDLPSEVAQADDAENEIIDIAEEISKNTELAEILLDTIEIGEGVQFTLHTLVDMRETSHHEDVWTFYAKVRLYNGCIVVGDDSFTKVIKDKKVTRQTWTGFIELAPAEATPDLSQVTLLEVVVKTKVCRYGWFSGKSYGCGSAIDEGDVTVEFMDNANL